MAETRRTHFVTRIFGLQPSRAGASDANAVVVESQHPGELKRLRPWFLIGTLAFLWFTGMFGTMAGCGTVSFLREGSIPSEPAIQEVVHANDLNRIARTAELRSVAELKSRTFPLGVGKLLLSGLLVVASAGAIAGRRGARPLLVQAIVANLLFVGLEWALLPELRAHQAQALNAASPHITGPEGETLRAQLAFMKSSPLVYLGIEIAVFVAGLAAVMSIRGRGFFEALDRAHDRARERERDADD